MVQWYLSNKGGLLEKLRQVLGGTVRPDNLYWYSGVMPVADVTQLTKGQVRTATNVTAVTVGGTGFNQGTVVALNSVGLIPNGKIWKILAVSMRLTTAGNAATTVTGWDLQLQLSGTNNLYGTAFSYVEPYAIGGSINCELGSVVPAQPFYLTRDDSLNITVSCGAFTTSGPTCQLNLLFIEEDEQ